MSNSIGTPHQLMLNSLQQLLNVSKESKDNKLKKTKNNSVPGLSDPQNKRFKAVFQQIERIIAKNNTIEKQTQKNILDILGVALKNKQKTINFNLIKEKEIQEQLRMQYNDICNNICEMSQTLTQIKQQLKTTVNSPISQLAKIVKYNEIKKTELQQFISQFASFKNQSIQITLNLTPNSKNKDSDKLTFDVSKMRQMYLTLKQCDKMINQYQNKTNKANEWWGKRIIGQIQQIINENKAGKEKQSKLNQQIKQTEDSNRQCNMVLKAVINNLSGYAYSQFNEDIGHIDKQLQQGLIKIKKELEGSSDLSKIIYRQIITYMNDSVFNEGPQQFSIIQTMNKASTILTMINQKRLPQIKRMFNKMKNVTQDYDKCTCIRKKIQYKNKITVNTSNSYVNNFNNTVKSIISQNLTSSRAKSQSSNQNTENQVKQKNESVNLFPKQQVKNQQPKCLLLTGDQPIANWNQIISKFQSTRAKHQQQLSQQRSKNVFLKSELAQLIQVVETVDIRMNENDKKLKIIITCINDLDDAAHLLTKKVNYILAKINNINQPQDQDLLLKRYKNQILKHLSYIQKTGKQIYQTSSAINYKKNSNIMTKTIKKIKINLQSRIFNFEMSTILMEIEDNNGKNSSL